MLGEEEVPLCPCGYRTECGIWCGYGHRDGMCPPKEGVPVNAERCEIHRLLIDVRGPDGIYYPWTCSCVEPEPVEEFHWVDGVRYMCYSDDHYCPYGGL